MFCRLVLANLPRRVTQAKFHVDCSSPDVLIQHVALEGKDGMQACLAVMGLKGPMWEEPLLPWELVFSSQVHAHLHPEADDHYVLNPQPVVGNNKALGKMSLNLTPTATSRIWWSKEGTLPYFVQGKIMGNFPWKGSVQTTGLICFLNLTFVKSRGVTARSFSIFLLDVLASIKYTSMLVCNSVWTFWTMVSWIS